MALTEKQLLQDVNLIAESLSSSERKSLFFLCENMDTDDDVACLKEMLKSKVMSCQNGHLFLAELVLQLRRYDILRRVFKTSRDEAERTLKYMEFLPRFR